MIETPELRSRIMRAVKGRDTKPELLVRRLAHRIGFRFRLHLTNLPGKPDLAFIKNRKVVFVHGCFWHGHACARGARLPKTNRAYWLQKVQRNKQRDVAAKKALVISGWKALTIWECELKDPGAVTKRLQKFLRQPASENHLRRRAHSKF